MRQEIRRVLVTGGAGFIGSNFVRHLMRRSPGVSVVVLDKLTYAGNLENLADLMDSPRMTFIEGDICDAARVKESLAGCDALLNFAAETHVDRSIESAGAFVMTDVFGAYVLLEAARESGLGRFIQISTDEVYGDAGVEPSGEESPLNPRSPYAASKAGGDRLAFSYWATHGVPVVITRCSNNYGPYQYPEKLIPLFVTNALEDQDLPVYGSGANTRDWIHVEDHCAALHSILFAEGLEGEVLNIGSGAELSSEEIGRAILKTLEKPGSLLKHVADRPGHVRRHAVRTEKIRRVLGWEPEVAFESGLASTLQWYRQNRGWWERIKSGEFREYYRRMYGHRGVSGAGGVANAAGAKGARVGGDRTIGGRS
jgi:dTDP-glucose 4,6-dehydratase